MERKGEAKQEEAAKKHPWPLLLLGIIFFIFLGYGITNWSPDFTIVIGSLKISILLLFFILLFAAMYTIIGYFTISSLQGFIFATAVIIYLLLRYFGITHPLFGLLLLAMLISIEFAIYKKK